MQSRYSRQILYDKVGVAGQQKLAASRVVLFGCGALGTVIANTLVRAGIGFLRICDRDFIEYDNLQRQVLFDESDIAANLPKAQAAANKLRAINSEVTIDPYVIDVNPTNIVELADGADLLLDGTDNFETRFLINDLAVQSRRPWIYGAVIGATGLCMTIVPGRTPCLRCVFEEAPPPEMNPTCDTAGVLGSAVNMVASLQAIEAMKLLMGRTDEINPHLVHLDVWTGRMMNMNVQAASPNAQSASSSAQSASPNAQLGSPNAQVTSPFDKEGQRGAQLASPLDKGGQRGVATAGCPCCARGEFEFLNGKHAGLTTTLCGRDAVQISAPPHSGDAAIDFTALAAKLAAIASAPIRHNPYMLRAQIDQYEMTLFPDARAIIKGTSNPSKARSLYAKYFGS